MNTISTDTHAEGIHAHKDSALVYRACSRAYANLLGAREPDDILGQRDSTLLRASRSALWEATQRLLLLDGVCSLTPLAATNRHSAWMVQSTSAERAGVDIAVVTFSAMLDTLGALAPDAVRAGAAGVVVVTEGRIIAADSAGREWARSGNGLADVTSQFLQHGEWQAWLASRAGCKPPEASLEADPAGSNGQLWLSPLRWHRQRCVLVVLAKSVETFGAGSISPAPDSRGELTEDDNRLATTHALLDASPVGTLLLRGQRIEFANATAARLLGHTSPVALSEATVLPADLLNQLEGSAESGEAIHCKWRRQDGRELLARLTARWVAVGPTVQLVVHIDDRLPLLRQLSTLTADRERFQDFAESAADYFFELDAALRFTYLSDRFESVFGVRPDDVLGLSIDSFHSRYLPQPTSPEWSRHLSALRTGQSQLDFEFRWTRDNGGARILMHSCHSVRDADGMFRGFRGVGRDITRDRELAEQIEYHATHDALTGLVNRREFERLLSDALESARQSPMGHALCFIDLDHFKHVNDDGGHQAGDAVLRELGSLFIDNLRQSDAIGRLGGDEFGVLIYNCDLAKAESLANDLRKAVEAYQLDWEGVSYRVGASIGVVPIGRESGDIEAVMREADSACYAAKHAGRGRISVLQDAAPPAEKSVDSLVARRLPVMREMMMPLQPAVRGDVQRLGVWGESGDQASPLNDRDLFALASAQALQSDYERNLVSSVLAWIDDHGAQGTYLRQAQLRMPGAFLADAGALDIVGQLLAQHGFSDKLWIELTHGAAQRALEGALDTLAEARCRYCVSDDSLAARFTGQSGLLVHAEAVARALSGPRSRRQLLDGVAAAKHDGLQVQVVGVADLDLLPALRDMGVDLAAGAVLAAPDYLNAEPLTG